MSKKEITEEQKQNLISYIKKESIYLFLSFTFTILCAASFGAAIGYVISIKTMFKFGLMQIAFMHLYNFVHGYFFDEMEDEVEELYEKVKDVRDDLE